MARYLIKKYLMLAKECQDFLKRAVLDDKRHPSEL
jgi:hypothetical protein